MVVKTNDERFKEAIAKKVPEGYNPNAAAHHRNEAFVVLGLFAILAIVIEVLR